MLERNVWFRTLVILLVVLAAFSLIGQLWDLALRFGDIIMLFTLAWLLAFVLRPLARGLYVNYHVPWTLSVAVVYLVFFASAIALAVIFVPILVDQLGQLVVAVPAWLQALSNWYASIQYYLPEQVRTENLPNILGQSNLMAQLQALVTGGLQNALGLATGVATALFGLVIVLILSFYLTVDGDRIAAGTVRIVPAEHKDEVRFLLESVDRSFGGFLRGQIIQAVVYAAGTAAVMTVTNLGYVALFTTIAGLAMFIPFIGPAIAIIPPIVLAAVQGPVSLVVVVTVALLVLQQLVFNVIAPKVMSDAVGLHPVMVFLAILVGGKVAGIAGAIFGVPVVAVLSAMAGFFYGRSHAAKTPPPPETVEQQPDEAGTTPAPAGDTAGHSLLGDFLARLARQWRRKEIGGS